MEKALITDEILVSLSFLDIHLTLSRRAFSPLTLSLLDCFSKNGSPRSGTTLPVQSHIIDKTHNDHKGIIDRTNMLISYLSPIQNDKCMQKVI